MCIRDRYFDRATFVPQRNCIIPFENDHKSCWWPKLYDCCIINDGGCPMQWTVQLSVMCRIESYLLFKCISLNVLMLNENIKSIITIWIMCVCSCVCVCVRARERAAVSYTHLDVYKRQHHTQYLKYLCTKIKLTVNNSYFSLFLLCCIQKIV